MPRLKHSIPKLRLHKHSGRARVQLGNREFYLGPFGSAEAEQEYNRLVGNWLAAGRPTNWNPDDPVARQPSSVITVSQVVVRYAEYLHERWPAPEGKKRSPQVTNRTTILRRFRTQCGPILTDDFGPLALQEFRKHLISLDHSRKYINMQIDLIKRMFKWAVTNEIFSAEKLLALTAVEGLREREGGARDSTPISPVTAEIVDKTLPFLSETVADMVRIQRLTGMRPGELCQMTPADIARTEDVWAYRPKTHKTQARGKQRLIAIGPKAQEVLTKYLLRSADDFCFCPDEVVKKLMNERKTKATIHKKYESKANPIRSPGKCYTTSSYRRAIHRACDLAGLEKWSPHRLRHATATDVRARFGLEGAQVVLGHSNAKTSEIYAEQNYESAFKIMKQIG